MNIEKPIFPWVKKMRGSTPWASSPRRSAMAIGMAGLLASVTVNAELVNSYDFDGDLSDTLGNGLDLTDSGGILSEGRYSFSNNQGLRLTSALSSTTDYAIEIRFRVNDDLLSWNKLVDYEELGLDLGLYVFEGAVDFWTIGPIAGTVELDTDQTVAIARAAGSIEVFLDGVSLFTADDSGNQAVSVSNILNFFVDDFATGQDEAFTGSVDFIRIHDDASTLGSEPPPDANSNKFSIVVIPDTQGYVEANPEILEAQIDWIVRNRDAENIIYVAHLGDLKDSKVCDNVIVTNGSGNSRTEWKIVDDAFDILDDAGIPYGVVPGNHDYDSIVDGNPAKERCPLWNSPAERPLSLYNRSDFFGPERFTQARVDGEGFNGEPYYGDPDGSKNALGQQERGNRVDGSNEDSFTLFEGSCGLKFIAVNLAYKEGANQIGGSLGGGAEIEWADRLLRLYPDRLGILTSHNFLNQNPVIDDARNFGGSFGGEYGTDVYNGVTSSNPENGNPNLIMMLSAHERGEAWMGFPTPGRSDNQGAARRPGMMPIHALLADYQSVDYPSNPNTGNLSNGVDDDGDEEVDEWDEQWADVDFGNLVGVRSNVGNSGFMRIMRFDPETQMIDIRTFSPPVSFLDSMGNPYTYMAGTAPAEREATLWSTYFPANEAGDKVAGTRMDSNTASNISFSFADYGLASAANTCILAP